MPRGSSQIAQDSSIISRAGPTRQAMTNPKLASLQASLIVSQAEGKKSL